MELILHVTLLLTSPLLKTENVSHCIIISLQLPVTKFAAEVIPIHVDVVHVTTDAIAKHWNEISLCRPRILSAPVRHAQNVSTYVNNSDEVDCLVLLFYCYYFIYSDIACMIYYSF